MRRVILLLITLALLAFGGASVHYTSAEDLDHHREWAAEHGMPAPQPAITIVGWITIATGIVTLIAAMRARKRA